MTFKSHAWAAIAVAFCAVLTLEGSATKAANFLIENVTLLDGTARPALSGASVLVMGNRISVVSQGPIKHESGVEVIDGKGKFLIPGLIDTHIHLQSRRTQGEGKPGFDHQFGISALHGYLYSGVTSVFDAGNNPDYIFPMREEERTGKIVSPRIFATGRPITVPGGYGDGPGALRVVDWATARPELDAYFKQNKPDLQKILIDRHGVFTPLNPSPSVDVLKKIIQLANENGIRTTVHAASEEDYNDALEGGIDNFAHVIRYPATDAIIKRVATKRVVISTTMVVFNYIDRIATDPSFLDTPLFKATVDQAILERQKTTERKRYIDSGMSAQYGAMRNNVPVNAKKIFDAGGVLALGTDRTWGPTVHMELELIHNAGIPLSDLVRIATLNGATYLGKEKDLGSIERGKFADMVLLNADPTQDVKNFQAIAAVFKGGERINLSTLEIPINAQGAKTSAPKRKGK